MITVDKDFQRILQQPEQERMLAEKLIERYHQHRELELRSKS